MFKKAQSTVKDLMVIAIFIFSLSAFVLSTLAYHKSKNPTGYFIFSEHHNEGEYAKMKNNHFMMNFPFFQHHYKKLPIFHPKPYKYGPLTQKQVVEQTPAYHLLKDIYTVINGKYYPIVTKEGYINGSLIAGPIKGCSCKNNNGFTLPSGGCILYNGANCPEGLEFYGISSSGLKICCKNVPRGWIIHFYRFPTLNGKCVSAIPPQRFEGLKKVEVTILKTDKTSFTLVGSHYPSHKYNNIIYIYKDPVSLGHVVGAVAIAHILATKDNPVVYVTHDDGYAVYLNGNLISSYWKPTSAIEKKVTLPLKKGQGSILTVYWFDDCWSGIFSVKVDGLEVFNTQQPNTPTNTRPVNHKPNTQQPTQQHPGHTIPSCHDQCSPGQVKYRCNGNEVQKITCVKGSQGCYVWSGWQTIKICPSGTVCKQTGNTAECKQRCSNQCAADQVGQYAYGCIDPHTVEVDECVLDRDGCYHWKRISVKTCPSGTYCYYGFCKQRCSNQCSPGQVKYKFTSFIPEVCLATYKCEKSSNGCYEWKFDSQECGKQYRSPPCDHYGDPNHDGIINWKDVKYCFDHIDKGYVLECDVNGDGKLDMGDVIKINAYRLGTLSTFPVCHIKIIHDNGFTYEINTENCPGLENVNSIDDYLKFMLTHEQECGMTMSSVIVLYNYYLYLGKFNEMCNIVKLFNNLANVKQEIMRIKVLQTPTDFNEKPYKVIGSKNYYFGINSNECTDLGSCAKKIEDAKCLYPSERTAAEYLTSLGYISKLIYYIKIKHFVSTCSPGQREKIIYAAFTCS